MNATFRIIPRHLVGAVWPLIEEGVEIYRTKTPHHIGTVEEIRANLESEDGDELMLVFANGEYAGFMTFKIIAPEPGETWCTFAIIYADTAAAKKGDVIAAIVPEFAALMKGRGCTHINYLTSRKGFAKWAPRLGFRARIVEWNMELT